MYIYLLVITSILTIVINTYLVIYLIKGSKEVNKRQGLNQEVVQFTLTSKQTGKQEVQQTELLGETEEL